MESLESAIRRAFTDLKKGSHISIVQWSMVLARQVCKHARAHAGYTVSDTVAVGSNICVQHKFLCFMQKSGFNQQKSVMQTHRNTGFDRIRGTDEFDIALILPKGNLWPHKHWNIGTNLSNCNPNWSHIGMKII